MLKTKLSFKMVIGILAVFIALVYLNQPKLPNCNSSDVLSLIKEIVNKQAPFIDLTDIVEQNSDKKNGKICQAIIKVEGFDNSNVRYKVYWTNNSYNPFLEKGRHVTVQFID